MMNSPCAMLITFIKPNEKARPSEINSRIELRLRPLNACKNNVAKLATPRYVSNSHPCAGSPMVVAGRTIVSAGDHGRLLGQAFGPSIFLEEGIRLYCRT